jgi:hypothetical protein
LELNKEKVKNNYIRGDKYSITQYFRKEFYLNHFGFFKKYNLIFLNQITTLDGAQILG